MTLEGKPAVVEYEPSGKRSGRPRTRDRRVILAAIVHQMQTGCAWNALPSHFLPYQTVHWQLRQWQKSGVWAKIWDGLAQPFPSG
ncbi:MAG: transposase [Chloroflexales bacterium]